jgi:hypothetical protein
MCALICSCIRDAIAAVQDNVSSLEKQAADLVADQRNLEAKLKKRQQELERGEKRLQSLQTVRLVNVGSRLLCMTSACDRLWVLFPSQACVHG